MRFIYSQKSFKWIKADQELLEFQNTSGTTKQELLDTALEALDALVEHWSADDVAVHESEFSFDELVSELHAVEFKE